MNATEVSQSDDSVLSACGEGSGERLARVANPPPVPSPLAGRGEHADYVSASAKSEGQRPFKLHLVEGTSLKRLVFSIIVGLVLSYVGLLLYGTMFVERMIFLPPVTGYRD